MQEKQKFLQTLLHTHLKHTSTFYIDPICPVDVTNTMVTVCTPSSVLPPWLTLSSITIQYLWVRLLHLSHFTILSSNSRVRCQISLTGEVMLCYEERHSIKLLYRNCPVVAGFPERFRPFPGYASQKHNMIYNSLAADWHHQTDSVEQYQDVPSDCLAEWLVCKYIAVLVPTETIHVENTRERYSISRTRGALVAPMA